jgi:NAD-dependent deacetylase
LNGDLSREIERAARLVADARYVIALVGAGISVESGIPPFRGPGGLWTRFGEPGNDQWQRFLKDPAAWWRERMRGPSQPGVDASSWEKAQPNPAHYALAELEAMGVLRHVVTQNVDNLHQAAGTVNITEFHGNRYKLRCLGCGARWPRSEFELSADAPPACPRCGGVVKSDTVMFGEPIPRDALDRGFAEARKADCILIVGTSATVYPAAELPDHVRRNAGVLIEVNPMETSLSGFCDVVLRGPAGSSLPALVGAVRRHLSERPAR